MDDYGKLWDNYSIEFNAKLVNSNGDWNKLDEDEQEIAALWKLFVDINNGGFIQFFCNWGFQCFCYAMRGLKRIDDTSLYELLADTYYDVLEKFKDDTRYRATPARARPTLPCVLRRLAPTESLYPVWRPLSLSTSSTRPQRTVWAIPSSPD